MSTSVTRPDGFSFTYRVTDGTTGSGQFATVRITVNPVNDAPGAGNDTVTGTRSHWTSAWQKEPRAVLHAICVVDLILNS